MRDQLGEQGLSLPELLRAALAADDRLKLTFTLLQAAERRADHPEASPPDLHSEHKAAGLETELQDWIRGSGREADASRCAPGAQRLLSDKHAKP